MKRLFTLLFSLMLVGVFSTSISAQNCELCTPDFTLTEPGLAPEPDSLPCINQGEYYEETIQIKNFDTVDFGGAVVVQYIILDSITNAPCGIGWNTNKQNAATPNRFDNQENGCINICGTTNDAAGQYKLGIWVTADIGFGAIGGLNADQLGLRFDLRVKAAASACPAIDTGATSEMSSCITGEIQGPAAGITPIKGLSALTISPTVVQNGAIVTFESTEAKDYDLRIVDILGREYFQQAYTARIGSNLGAIDANDLANGTYFYVISDGKRTVTQRFIVER